MTWRDFPTSESATAAHGIWEWQFEHVAQVFCEHESRADLALGWRVLAVSSGIADRGCWTFDLTRRKSTPNGPDLVPVWSAYQPLDSPIIFTPGNCYMPDRSGIPEFCDDVLHALAAQAMAARIGLPPLRWRESVGEAMARIGIWK